MVHEDCIKKVSEVGDEGGGIAFEYYITNSVGSWGFEWAGVGNGVTDISFFDGLERSNWIWVFKVSWDVA